MLMRPTSSPESTCWSPRPSTPPTRFATGPVLAARHGGQVALLLLPRAVRAEHVGEHEMRVEDAREAHPAAAELLDDHRVGGVVEAEAAVLERDGGAEEPELLHALDQRLRVLVGVLVAARDRHHLALDEAPDRVEHLLGELLAIVHDSPLVEWRSSPCLSMQGKRGGGDGRSCRR